MSTSLAGACLEIFCRNTPPRIRGHDFPIFSPSKNGHASSPGFEPTEYPLAIKHGWLENPRAEWRFLARKITELNGHGKSPLNGGFNRIIMDKWSMASSQPCLMTPEGTSRGHAQDTSRRRARCSQESSKRRAAALLFLRLLGRSQDPQAFSTKYKGTSMVPL